MNNRYFTKSAYKIAFECPTRLYYCCDDRYENQDNSNEFMQSLANGGFQVGELAKIYYHIDDSNTVPSKNLDYEDSLKITEQLFQQEKVNIAEAAFRFKNYYVRADIIEKSGNEINLIEVKAKSYSSEKGIVIETAKGLESYIEDVAFQKYVVEGALKYKYPNESIVVHAFLLMADKAIPAPVNGMNQFFKVCNNDENRIIIMPGAEKLAEERHILTAFDVDGICNDIIKNPDYSKRLDRFSKAFCNHEKIDSPLSHICFKCPFFSTAGEKRDGFKECWKTKAGFEDGDFERASIRDFGMNGRFWEKADRLIQKGVFFMEDLSSEDVSPNNSDLSIRRLIQLGLETNDDSIKGMYGASIVDEKLFLDKEGLSKEMEKWNYPLHFIDFETAASALPFYVGMKPYEDVAFQFSHHIVSKNEDGSYKIEHAGQYLNTEKGFFPNFVFVRKLKSELEKDSGTIFRYANHENKILRIIRRQLTESNEVDRDELISFIDAITHSGKKETIEHVGVRDMVDLEAVIKKYFLFPKFMKGRTSIKVVLPAVLNASKFLQEKYSRPIYGSEIKSCNYSGTPLTVSWIQREEDGITVKNPYHELEKIEKEILRMSGFSDSDYIEIKEELGETVANGGAALTAYSKLQFSDMTVTKALSDALLRYCELDTMAMVFIWEYFYNAIQTR